MSRGILAVCVALSLCGCGAKHYSQTKTVPINVVKVGATGSFSVYYDCLDGNLIYWVNTGNGAAISVVHSMPPSNVVC